MSDAAPPKSRRTLYIVLGAIGALLIAVVVLLVVVISQNNAAAEQHDHERIVKICEEQLTDPYGEQLDQLLDCIERLKEN